MQSFVRGVVTRHHHHHRRQPNLSFNNPHRIFSHTSGGSGIAHIHTPNPKPPQLGHHHPFHRFHSWHSSYHTLSSKIRSRLSQPTIAFRRITFPDFRPRLPALHFSAQRFISHPKYGSFRRIRRSWYDSQTPEDMVWCLIKANAAIFLLWGIAGKKFMRNNFTLTLDNIKNGRFHTLITNAFSHVDFKHILFNMLGLYYFGINIGRSFGSGFLLRLYLAGAVGGSVFYLVHHSKGWRNANPSAEGLGASGAVHAIVLFKIFLCVPVPLVWLGAFWIWKDMRTFLKGKGDESGPAYLGGGAVAAIAWALVRRGIC